MANSKVSDLVETTTITDADEFWINDGGTSKRITYANLEDSIKDTTLGGLTPVQAVAFGVAFDGVTDDTTNLQAAIDSAASNGIGFVDLPEGTAQFTSLEIPAYVHLRGVGMKKTVLECTSTTADAITLKNQSGTPTNYFNGLSYLSVTSTSARTAGASGSGVVADNSDVDHVSFQITLNQVYVSGHPDDGIKVRAPENNNFNQVMSSSNGGKGFYFFNDNDRGLGNTYTNLRAMNNGSYAIHTYHLNGAVFISPEALVQEGTQAYSDELVYIQAGRRVVLINIDVERNNNPVAANIQDYGVKLIGDTHQIIGGVIDNCKVGVNFVAAVGCVVDNVQTGLTSTNISAEVADSVGYNLAGVDCVGNRISFYNNSDVATSPFKRMAAKYSDLGVATAFFDTGKYKCISGSNVQQVTIAASACDIDMDTGDTFRIETLDENITINDPTGDNLENGDSLKFIITQDSTGSRVVTLDSAFYPTTPTIKTGAGLTTILEFTYNGAVWHLNG